MVPLLPSVTSFSATERAALAFASVVVTRLCSIRLQTRFASIALRCSDVRPSLAVLFKCRITSLNCQRFFLRRVLDQPGLKIHAQRQAQRRQLVLDFVQGLLAEVAV